MRKLIVGFILAALTAGNAYALSSESALISEYTKKAVADINDYNDAALFNVKYVGSSTQAAVVITQGAFGTEAPIGTADLALTTANYATVGAMCDAINADADYVCTMKDGKRDDSSVLMKIVAASAATDAKAAGGYDVLIDTGGTTATDPYILRLGITPATDKRVVLKYCTGNINAVDSLAVYGKLAKYEGVSDGVTRNDSTLVYSEVTADDTDKTIGNIYDTSGWIEFAKNEHVVIGSVDGDTTQAAGNFIKCAWFEK